MRRQVHRRERERKREPVRDRCNPRPLSEEAEVTEYEYEDENEVSAYTDIRMNDLIQYGISAKCLDEIKENLGHYAIEALHDLL